jgi:hypothetical protein
MAQYTATMLRSYGASHATPTRLRHPRHPQSDLPSTSTSTPPLSTGWQSQRLNGDDALQPRNYRTRGPPPKDQAYFLEHACDARLSDPGHGARLPSLGIGSGRRDPELWTGSDGSYGCCPGAATEVRSACRCPCCSPPWPCRPCPRAWNLAAGTRTGTHETNERMTVMMRRHGGHGLGLGRAHAHAHHDHHHHRWEAGGAFPSPPS